jgi:hypothetical protein
MLRKLLFGAITLVSLSSSAKAIEAKPGYFTREQLSKMGSTYQVNDNHLILNSVKKSGDSINFLLWRENNLYRINSKCEQFESYKSIWYVESHPAKSVTSPTAEPGEAMYRIVEFICR